MLIAAFVSAFIRMSQCLHWNTAWLSRLFFAQYPQREQIWLVYAGFTSIRMRPASLDLYASCSRTRPRFAWFMLWLSLRFAA